MGFFKKLSEFTADTCTGCGNLIESGDLRYIAYPRDYYCLSCAEDHPDFNR